MADFEEKYEGESTIRNAANENTMKKISVNQDSKNEILDSNEEIPGGTPNDLEAEDFNNAAEKLDEIEDLTVSSTEPVQLTNKRIANVNPTVDAVEDVVAPSVVVGSRPPACIETEDPQGKLPSEGENSPPATDDSLGRRKRKPSRYHDSMFDIPTNLMNINRTINPEEFRAFHSKTAKQKEKPKKVLAVSAPPRPKVVTSDPMPVLPMQPPALPTLGEISITSFQPEARAHEDDILESNSMFKFKMRKDHIIQNTIGGPTAYKCDICMMTFPRSFSLRRHYTRRHINPRYVLPKSGSIVAEPGNTEIPLEQVPQFPDDGTEESRYLYACKMCSKTLMFFKHKNHLRVHCLEMHNSEPRRPVSVFKCQLCKRSYTTRHELERHKRTHSGERPYACSYCHKTFPTSTNARRHERTHTGDKPHVCKVCNKGFIQRTDMVNHLRAIHKMKVTKTKAERGASRKQVFELVPLGGGRGSKNDSIDDRGSDYGVDSGNEFQENIDFAAYLKLDQHDSGTLMGEKALQRGALGPYIGKGKQLNNSMNNNHLAAGNTSADLKDLQPSEIMGEDGRPEKCHRCPDCSKMFTSNINLRRHHKLKHERNQLYQCAEPVSMVVEKYKIKDDVVGTLFEPDTATVQEQRKEGNGMDILPMSMDSPAPDQNIAYLKKGEEVQRQDENVANKEEQENESSYDKPIEHIVAPSSGPTKKFKSSKLSKLSSIVQRLAVKRSAEQPMNETSDDQSVEKEPIAKLEEMGSQLFGPSFSPDVTGMSPKRKKRKPTSVQQVKSYFDDSTLVQRDSRPRLLPEMSYTKSFMNKPSDAYRNVSGLSSETEAIFRKVFRSNDSRTPMHIQKKHPREDFSRRFSGSPGIYPYRQKEFRPRTSLTPDGGFTGLNEISNSFASLTQEPFPMGKMPRNLVKPEPGQMAETSRIENFLSQCWSSRKRGEIPQNAVLGRNMPSRDAYALTRKLKHDMRHLSDDRINEHLPPSAYFSRRDNMPSVTSPRHMAAVFSKDGGQRRLSDPDTYEKTIKSENTSDRDGANAPLDLRVPSKKVVQDYVVRDDGVLDFSQKTRNSLASGSQSGSPNPISHVKIEPGTNRSDMMFQDKKPQMPIPIPNMDKIPPWLQASHQIFWNKAAGNSGSMLNPPMPDHLREPFNPPMPEHIREPLNHPMPERRREIVYGRQMTMRANKKPFKFHSMDFRHGHPKSGPPQITPYRVPPYMKIGPNGKPQLMNAPIWPDPKDEKPILYSGNKLLLSQHGHKHFPSDSPCSLCDARSSPIPPPSHHVSDPLRFRDGTPRMPYQSTNKNFPFHQRQDFLAKDRTQSPHLRTILPKMGQKDDTMESRSPFDRDMVLDQDMMNRCIIKAQQALKTKPSHEGEKRPLLSHDVPVFKSGSQHLPYMQKMRMSHSIQRPAASKAIATSSTQAPRITAHMQMATIPPDPVIKSKYKSPTKRAESSLPAARDNAEGSHDGSDDREKLTMTPELEGTQDDGDKDIQSQHSSEVKSNSESCTKPTGMEVVKSQADSVNDDAETIAKLEKPTNLAIPDGTLHKEETEQARPKSCDTTFGRGELSYRSPSPSSDVSCSKSASPIHTSKKSSLKISHRRHTHAIASQRKKQSSPSSKNKSLKRSNSSESPQGDEEGTIPKKLIKKLKLRVIKSPGSEHKKYWTLVKQDNSKAQSSEKETPVDEKLQIPPKEDITDENTPPKKVKNQSEENAPTTTERDSLSQEKETDNKVTKMQEVEETKDTEAFGQSQSMNKTKEGDNKLENTVTLVSQHMEANDKPEKTDILIPQEHNDAQEPEQSDNNILTGKHVENALSAITLPPEGETEQSATDDSSLNDSGELDAEVEDPEHLNNGDVSKKENAAPTANPAFKSSAAEVEPPPVTELVTPRKTAETIGTVSAHKTDTENGGSIDSDVITTGKGAAGDFEKISVRDFVPSGKEDGIGTTTGSGKKPKARKTRSGVANVVTVVKKAQEKGPVVSNVKKAEAFTAGSSANRLRRSVRIRKTSADKDKETTGKKKK